MTKTRSPRFPFIPLEEALDLLRKLEAFQSNPEKPLRRPEMLKALDYASFHGAAVKTIGALRAYDLLVKQEDGVTISPTGRKLLEAPTDEERIELLQRAALSPLTFRMIWRRARHCSRSELTEILIGRGFTEAGAKRASKVYRKNSKLAQLEILELEPDLPERGKHGRGQLRGEMRRRPDRNRRHQARTNPNSLTLPLSAGLAIIPKGISEEEFTRLLQTLRTWKDHLIVAE